MSFNTIPPIRVEFTKKGEPPLVFEGLPHYVLRDLLASDIVYFDKVYIDHPFTSWGQLSFDVVDILNEVRRLIESKNQHETIDWYVEGNMLGKRLK